MRLLKAILITLITIPLFAQFDSNTTHIFPVDTDKNFLIGTQTPNNSADYKIYVDLRPHFTTLGDDESGIKFKTGLYALEFDNSATSIDPNYDHPVIKPSGNYVGFLGKPGHRWFHIYGSTFHADTILSNGHLMYEIGDLNNQWKRLWSETIRAKNYFPLANNTGQIGAPDFLYKEVFATDINCVTFLASSDARLKENLRPVEHPIEKIKALQAWQYDYHLPNTDVVKSNRIGVLAQEVEAVLPELVETNEATQLQSVDYIGLIPVLLEGIKAQQTMIETQQEELEALKKRIEQLEHKE